MTGITEVSIRFANAKAAEVQRCAKVFFVFGVVFGVNFGSHGIFSQVFRLMVSKSGYFRRFLG